MRGEYDKTHPNLKVQRRGKRAYYYAQVSVPKDQRNRVGKSVLTKYIGAVTESEAKRRAPAIVAELQHQIGLIETSERFKQAFEGMEYFGPTNEQEATAREVLSKTGLKSVTDSMVEQVAADRLEQEKDRELNNKTLEVDDKSVWGVFQSWLDYKAGTGRKTRSKERGEIQRRRVAEEFCEFVGRDKSFGEIDHIDAQNFKVVLFKQGLKAHTVDNKMNMISGCFKDRRPGTFNPFAGLNHKKEVYKEQENARADFTDDQVAALIDASRKQTDGFYWFISVAAYTGARKSEILDLHKEDFDFESGLIHFNKRAVGKSVAAKRSVPIHPKLSSIRQFVESRKVRVFRFASSTANRKFNLVKNELGIIDTKIKGESHQVTLHSFRHGVKTRLLNAGVSTDLVDQLIGHSRQGLNAVYAKRQDGEALRQAIKKLQYFNRDTTI